MQIGRRVREVLLETMSPEERLAGLDPAEAITQVGQQLREALLETMSPEERLTGLDPEELARLIAHIETFLEQRQASGDQESPGK